MFIINIEFANVDALAVYQILKKRNKNPGYTTKLQWTSNNPP